MEPPPLAVDIDGTLTDGTGALDFRACSVVADWPAPVVVATGKSFPYPVSLCQFLGIPVRIIAENGGVVAVADTDAVEFLGDRAAAQAVVEAYEAAGYDIGYAETDFANRWRETEVALSRSAPLEPLTELAEEHGLEVIDTGYAYHVKDPAMSKGAALSVVAEELGTEPSAFVAVGDSQNDASTFEVAGDAVAVANADDAARAAADRQTDAGYGEGFLEAVARYRQ